MTLSEHHTVIPARPYPTYLTYPTYPTYLPPNPLC